MVNKTIIFNGSRDPRTSVSLPHHLEEDPAFNPPLTPPPSPPILHPTHSFCAPSDQRFWFAFDPCGLPVCLSVPVPSLPPHHHLGPRTPVDISTHHCSPFDISSILCRLHQTRLTACVQFNCVLQAFPRAPYNNSSLPSRRPHLLPHLGRHRQVREAFKAQQLGLLRTQL